MKNGGAPIIGTSIGKWLAGSRVRMVLPPSLAVVPKENLEPLIGEEQGGLMVFVDGALVHYEFGESLARQGILFSDLREAASEQGELLQRYFMQEAVLPSDGKFAALHGAVWTHGVFLYVPRGVVADLPVHVVNYVTRPRCDVRACSRGGGRKCSSDHVGGLCITIRYATGGVYWCDRIASRRCGQSPLCRSTGLEPTDLRIQFTNGHVWVVMASWIGSLARWERSSPRPIWNWS